MKIVHSSEVQPQPVTESGASNTTIRWLLSRPEGAPNFAMRLFELDPGGSTPLHEHAWEHEVFILEGRAEVVQDTGPTPIAPGDAILLMPGERHQIRSVGDTPVRLLCMIPLPEEE
jgi:quercetin dioxygenase-like cupin family protein